MLPSRPIHLNSAPRTVAPCSFSWLSAGIALSCRQAYSTRRHYPVDRTCHSSSEELPIECQLTSIPAFLAPIGPKSFTRFRQTSTLSQLHSSLTLRPAGRDLRWEGLGNLSRPF